MKQRKGIKREKQPKPPKKTLTGEEKHTRKTQKHKKKKEDSTRTRTRKRRIRRRRTVYDVD
jgi:hypothetical protein